MTAGIWATSPDRVDMAAGFPAIREGVRTHGSIAAAFLRRERGVVGTFSLQGGLGSIGDAARIALGQTGVANVAADGLAADAAGWTVTTVQGSLHADAVVLAGDAAASAALLTTVSLGAAAALSAMEYSPLAVAHWIAADAQYPRGFGFLAEPASRMHSLGTLFTSDILPDRAPAGLRSFTTMFSDPDVADEAVRTALLAEHRALTGRDVAIAGLHVVRHPRAVAVPRPGHAARVAALQANLPPGIALAGAYLGAGAMEDAVRSGLAAAVAILAERRRHAA